MSKERKFLRKCIGCGCYKKKDDLFKITKEHVTEDIITLPQSNIYGRSCYVCKDKNCIKSAFKKSKISKTLKKNIEKSTEEKIITVLENMLVLQI